MTISTAIQQNLKILEANGRGFDAARVSSPREGSALLQGRAVCGRCGRHLGARYVARRGRLEAWYVCGQAHNSRGETSCQSIAGRPIDTAIGELIATEMTPAAVELALEIRKEIEVRHDEADRLRLRAVAKTQEERERERQKDRIAVDEAIRDRLVAMTTDFKTLWRDPSLPNRERKRLLAYIIEDVTLVKLPATAVRFAEARRPGTD